MITDITQIDPSVRYDCCVIGAGPAGLTVAMSLAERRHNVLLLEAGAFDFSDQSQEVYRGEVIGDPYFALEQARLRYFGGTSGHWAGWCRTLDEIDFLPKQNFPKAFWPIRKADLEPYVAAASEMVETWIEPADEEVPGFGIKRIHVTFSPPVLFGEKYHDKIRDARNITVCPNANVFQFQTNGSSITSVTAVNYDDVAVSIPAKCFVLACGGIENSRILLHANANSNGQIVKNETTLGKYWMEHPLFTIGSVLLFEQPQERRSFYSLTADKQRELGILNCALRVEANVYKEKTKQLIADIACVAPTLGEWALRQLGYGLVCGVQIRATWEQEPRPENRIELSKDAVDRFGVPRTVLHWTKSEKDLETLRKTALQYGEYLAQADAGRLKLDDWVLGKSDYPENDDLAGYHHMGGTRMADSAAEGVVDRNLKVWGQDNLYVCGSSVFPSSGHAMPTLTIVQLALRLTEHLSGEVARM